MKCMKVPLEEAETIKTLLIQKNILDRKYKTEKDSNYIYYPVKQGILGYPVINKILETKTPTTLREALEKKLTKKQLEKLNTAFDTVGSIAILEISRELEKKKKIIAEELLKINKNIKTVVQKKGGHKGIYRIQGYEYIAGEKKYETIYKENGIQTKLDITKVYFTPRLSTERLRIAKQIKSGEKVLVMFSGIGIYGFVISKNSRAKEIHCIEINKEGCKYCEENIKLNKTKNVHSYFGNVKKVIPTLGKITFDRVIMPLPKEAIKYLDLALSITKKGTIIHLYLFSTEEHIAKIAERIKTKYKFEILDALKVGQQSPRIWRWCMDLRVI